MGHLGAMSLSNKNSTVQRKPLPVFPPIISKSLLTLLLAFWFVAVWIFGSAYKQHYKASHLKVLVVDLDESSVGACLVAACEAISGLPAIVSFEFIPHGFSTLESAYADVWKGNHWGAIVAMPNATTRFEAAIHDGQIDFASNGLIHSFYNEARWVTMAESFIKPSFDAAVSELNTCYNKNYTSLLFTQAHSSQSSLAVLLNGIGYTTTTIGTLGIGIRPFLNTVGMVFPILTQFFFSMATGGIAAHTGWYNSTATRSRYLNHLGLSLLWTCIIGISWGLWLEVFREDLALSSGQYCLIWLIFWVYSLIAFEVLDTAAAFVPLPILPLCVLCYIILNVSASVFPIEVKPAFYHIDYIWPSYNCFELLITVLSDGACSRAYRNVPVLFAWLIVWMPLGWLATRRRCRATPVKSVAGDKLDLDG